MGEGSISKSGRGVTKILALSKLDPIADEHSPPALA